MDDETAASSATTGVHSFVRKRPERGGIAGAPAARARGNSRAERLHGDNTTVPVLAKGKTITGRLWTYVRDDRPFAGRDPSAAVFGYSRNRGGEHPNRHLVGYAGILQANAYAGFGELYDARRRPGPITEAACWSHARSKLFVLADTAKAPGAGGGTSHRREREINGLSADQRQAIRKTRVV